MKGLRSLKYIFIYQRFNMPCKMISCLNHKSWKWWQIKGCHKCGKIIAREFRKDMFLFFFIKQSKLSSVLVVPYLWSIQIMFVLLLRTGITYQITTTQIILIPRANIYILFKWVFYIIHGRLEIIYVHAWLASAWRFQLLIKPCSKEDR